MAAGWGLQFHGLLLVGLVDEAGYKKIPRYRWSWNEGEYFRLHKLCVAKLDVPHDTGVLLLFYAASYFI